MKFKKELDFLMSTIKDAYHQCSGKEYNISQKTEFDLVTDFDLSMEEYISKQINETFPDDKILGEEFTSNTDLLGRVWSIDPIDGTCNMAVGLKLYGVQCALIIDSEPVVSVEYLPHFDEWIYAVKGEGCYCNGERVFANSKIALNRTIVSFGDYTHKNPYIAAYQHRAMGNLYPQIEKIRMFGAACIDFASVAQGRTHGTVVITKNVWDIAPGVLICREAGAVVTDLKGRDYTFFSDGAVVASNKEVSDVILKSFVAEIEVENRVFRGVIFDFDGVVMDTEKFHYLAWKEAFATVGLSISPEEYEPLKSTGRNNVLDWAESKMGVPFGEDKRCELCTVKDARFSQMLNNADENDFIPGAIDFLKYLNDKKCRVAVASSSKSVCDIVKKFGLDWYFDVIIDGNSSYPKKPCPDIFNVAASMLNIPNDKCIVFEDSLSGIEAATGAGMAVVAIGVKTDKAFLSMSDFSNIQNLVSAVIAQ